jgi:hypothetical protein
VIWTSERWVVIGDGLDAPKDGEVIALTKRLTDLLSSYALKYPAEKPDAAAPVKPAVESPLSVELAFRKNPAVFGAKESLVVEARLVNSTDKKQVYRGGLGDKNIKSSCQLKLTAEGGKSWAARAEATAAYQNYKDIEVPAGGKTLIGAWDLSTLVYSEGARWSAGGRIPFTTIARPGRYRVRWWDGVFQAGAPLRSEPVDFEIAEAAGAEEPKQHREQPKTPKEKKPQMNTDER